MGAIIDFGGANGIYPSHLRSMKMYNEGFVWKTTRNYIATPCKETRSIIDLACPNLTCHEEKNRYILSFRCDDFCIYVDGKILSIYAKKEECLFDISNKLNELFVVRFESFKVSYASLGTNGINYRQLILKIDEVENVSPELYPDINIEYLAEDFAKASEKILLLYGIPGVGKTSFIRYLITNHISNKSILYVKDPSILNSGAFWSSITEDKYDYLILDDIGNDLSPRQSNNSSNFVSELLSYTSGILEQNSGKIIITTNQTIDSIDEAIVRPGRCFDFVTLHPLSFKEGKDLWCSKFNLPKETYDTLYGGMTEITQASLMSDVNRLTSGDTVRRYIKSENNNYSIMSKLTDLGITGKQPVGFAR